MLRLTISFSTGLLMSRVLRPRTVRGTFWICTLVLVVQLALHYMGSGSQPWLNALYEMVCGDGLPVAGLAAENL